MFSFLQNGLKVEGFTSEEKVGLMDELFMLLALWFRGARVCVCVRLTLMSMSSSVDTVRRHP